MEGKEKIKLRTYRNDTPQYNLYRDMHINQTLDYVLLKKKQYATLKNKQMTMKEALSQLDLPRADLNLVRNIAEFFAKRSR